MFLRLNSMEGSELLQHLNKIDTLNEYEVQLYSIDDVYCMPEKYPAFFVVNTGYSRGFGEHYLSFIIGEDRSVVYFDSYGFSPLNCFTEFWTKHKLEPVRYSTKWLQSPFSHACGHYQIAFGACMSAGVSFDCFIGTFTEDYGINDEMVLSFVSSL